MAKDFISIKYTKGAVAQIQKEINLISKIANLVIQVLVIVYYGAMIGMNHSDAFRVVLYSILLAVTLAAYIFSLALAVDRSEEKHIQKMQARRKRNVLFGLKLVNYAARITAVVYAFYLMTRYGAGDMTWILTILSAVLILINGVIDGIVYLARRYTNYLMVAVEADIAESGIATAYEKVSNPWKTLSEVTARVANRMEGVEDEEEEPFVSSDEKTRQKLFGSYEASRRQEEEQKERRRQQRKAANKAHRQEIKNNLKRIFGIHNEDDPD